MKKNKTITLGVALIIWLVSFQGWAHAKGTATYETVAMALVAGFNERDPTAFNQTVDPERILDTAFDGLLLEPVWEMKARNSLSTAITTRLGQRMISQMPDGGYARLLRFKEARGMGLALVRLDYGDSGNGYVDIHLVKDDQGRVRISDWFDYSSGQLYSESLRQLIATLSPTPTVIGKVFDLVSNRRDAAEKLSELVKLNSEQKYAEVVKRFLAMDETMRESRLLNLIAVQAANSSDDMELYRRALHNLAQFYGDDGTMAFILLDYYYMEGNYDKALRAIDLVEASFGLEEAGLTSIRANTLVEQGRYAEAAAEARHAIELEAEYEYSYWSLLTSQVLQDQFDEAVETAILLEDGFGYDMSPPSLGNVEGYTAFIESEAYRNWRGSAQ